MGREADAAPKIFSPVRYRYLLAAREIKATDPQILDIGGYRSRESLLRPLFRSIVYTSANIGPAWYEEESYDIQCSGCNIPVPDNSYDYVISVDTLEHIAPRDRVQFIGEARRVAKRKLVLVFPFDNGGFFFEDYLLDLSARWQINAMPSLDEHRRNSLPTLASVKDWAVQFDMSFKFETDRDLYWTFQLAMLINQAAIGQRSERVNREIQSFMEAEMAAMPPPPDEESAYRVVLLWSGAKDDGHRRSEALRPTVGGNAA